MYCRSFISNCSTRVSEKDEQNIALMSLIDYLGNSNMAIVAMAYNEVCTKFGGLSQY